MDWLDFDHLDDVSFDASTEEEFDVLVESAAPADGTPRAAVQLNWSYTVVQ